MLPALPAVPVAMKVTGLPVSPAAAAVSVFAPTVVLRVQLPTVAMPPASVVWLAPVMLPFPGVTAKVTATPDTGLPLASLTITDGGIGTAVPTVTVCLSPALIAICVAGPAVTVTVPDVAGVSCGAEKLRVRGPARPVIVRFVNAARPAASVAIGFAPDRAGPPLAMAAVTCVPLRLTALPAPSSSCTTGWRASATPLRTLSDGGVTSASCTAEPAASVMVPDVKGARPAAVNVSV